jgi:inhibitor of KinA sporulation pathway (predicted exonuclease)
MLMNSKMSLVKGIFTFLFWSSGLDVKTLYVFNQITQGKSPSGGLSKSMISYGLTFEGQSHRAEIDALNTLRFFFYFLEKQRKFEEYKVLMQGMK